MKRFLTVMAVLLVAGFQMNAQTMEKSFDVDDFTGINISDAFDVTLVQSSEYEVIVEITEDFLPYVMVGNKRGVLEVKLDKLPFSLKQKNRKKVAKVRIAMPKLNSIYLSGASTLVSDDEFSNEMRRCSIRLRGGSSITDLEFDTPDVEIELDGASKAKMRLRTSDVDIDLAGASKIELSGDATDMTIKAKGASKFDGERFEVREAKVDARGASTVDVNASRRLTVSLSGASKCRYYGDEDRLTLKAEKVSGASTLKHRR